MGKMWRTAVPPFNAGGVQYYLATVISAASGTVTVNSPITGQPITLTNFKPVTPNPGDTVVVLGTGLASDVVAGVPGLPAPAVTPSTYIYLSCQDGNLLRCGISPFSYGDEAALSLGSNMRQSAFDPAKAFLYVPDTVGGHVYKVNLSTFTVAATLAITTASACAVDPSGAYLYVTSRTLNTVSKVDLSTFTVVGSPLTVGSAPYGLAIDSSGTHMYVANNGGNSISRVALGTFTVSATLSGTTGIVGITIDPTDTHLYALQFGSSPASLYQVDLATFTVSNTVSLTGGYGFQLAIDPSGTYLYAPQDSGNVLSRVYLPTLAVTNLSVVGNANLSAVSVDATGTYAYTADNSYGRLYKIDLSTFTSMGYIALLDTTPIYVAID